MKNQIKLFICLLLLTGIISCNKQKMAENKLAKFIRVHEKVIIPLEKELNLTSYQANVTGKKEDYDKVAELTVKYAKIYANKEDFKLLKKLKESGNIKDSLLNRQLDILYLQFLPNQVDPKKLEEIINRETELENKYTTYRVEVDDKKYSDNQVDSILRNSKNSEELKKFWLASKEIGKAVQQDVLALVKMRNEIAKELGFSNYHEMSLKVNEQDPKEIEVLFDQLDDLTRDAFKQTKSEIDEYLAKRLKLKKDQLMPWDYQNRYFQEAPEIFNVKIDSYYSGKDVVKIAADFYRNLGLPVDSILAHSDLYEKPGKNQHAFCTDIDRDGDMRVLCNVRNDAYWMNTMLHELGHGIYEKYMDLSLPFILKAPAHTFTTEGIANFFGRQYSNPQWMKDNLGISEEEKKKIEPDIIKNLKIEQLIFSRWCQVMFRFEKSMYENPDQDLNKLWWDMVEKYQLLKKPEGRNEPDWASKIHLALYPAYYHNYLLGDLFASQITNYLAMNILKTNDIVNLSISNNKEVGKYLKEKIFMPADRYFWNEMIEKATGEPLNAKYYANQFVK